MCSACLNIHMDIGAAECEFVYVLVRMYVCTCVCTFTHSSSQPDVRTTLKERRCVRTHEHV